MKKTGLTLGKFAPFHRGHQHVIETALEEVDELIVVVYDAKEVIDIPLNTRANWIRKCYPTAEVIEGDNAPSASGYTPEIKQIQEQYILNLLKGRKITQFYSSEPYGEHMSEALGAENRTVDLDRVKFPVSGTAIRQNPYAHRALIHPVVYRDLITHIVFLGAPSTGKSTITEAAAAHFNTAFMPEYGREYWDNYNVDRRLTAEQLVELAEGHLQRENQKIMEANSFLFTDTNAITTYMFSQYYHGHALSRLKDLATMAETRYDLFFLCDIDIPYDDTWDRSGDVQRIEFQQHIIRDLESRKIPYLVLQGTVDERISTIENVLKTFKKNYTKS